MRQLCSAQVPLWGGGPENEAKYTQTMIIALWQDHCGTDCNRKIISHSSLT